MCLSAEERAEYERKGAVLTTVQEWLGLDDAEMQVVEFRVAMAKEMRRRRAARLSRKALAERLGVSQPSIADIEDGVSPSLEAVLLAFFATGGTLADLAPILADLPAVAATPKGRKKAEAV
jgi:DNA-binding XRE family transcriptional regulator